MQLIKCIVTVTVIITVELCKSPSNMCVSVLNVQAAASQSEGFMVMLLLCFITSSVYSTNENAAVSHYINLIIFTLPSLSACGANEILLMIRYNLTPFSGTDKDACVSRRSPEIR